MSAPSTTKVDLFVPCFVDQFYPESAWNTVKVLERLGCEVNYNTAQTCCGQPAWNAGFKEKMRPVAEKFLEDFDSNRYVVGIGGSCVGMIRGSYMDLFANSSKHLKLKSLQSRMMEFSEFLVDVLKVGDVGAHFEAKATYHDACGALRECDIKHAPRKLLDNVTGLELIEMEEVETCCGFGGTFAVKFESISTAMAQQKVTRAIATGAEYMISTDLSCLMHLQSYIDREKLPIKTIHLADVLVNVPDYADAGPGPATT